YDRDVSKMTPERKKLFDEGYRELVLSELLIALMKEDDVSVRALAQEAGLSSAIIQGGSCWNKAEHYTTELLKDYASTWLLTYCKKEYSNISIRAYSILINSINGKTNSSLN